MAKKKQLKECPVCKCTVKSENYSSHMRRVHGKKVKDEVVSAGGEKKKLKRSELRKLQLERKQKRMNIAFAASVIILVVVILLGYYSYTQTRAPGGTPAETINPTAGQIRIAKSDVADGGIHYYKYNDVTYYVHKNPNGNYKPRISECAPCGNQGDDTVPGRGFSLRDNGNIIYCNTCGTTWDSEGYSVINDVGCGDLPPSYLPNTQDDSYVYIDPQDVKWYQ